MLVVFAKAPVPGEVKTRMSPALSAETAAAFYREMLLDVLEETERTCAALGLAGGVTVSPASACEAFGRFVPARLRVIAQCAGDLGTRMAFEVERALATGAGKVVLRGSDNPALGADEVERLFDALDRCEISVSPDRDGGYGAIGLRTPPGQIFEHAMSHHAVLSATLERARRAGLRVEKTKGSFDLDTVDDLVHLAEARASLPKDRCRRTLAYADAHRLWACG